MAPVLTRIRNWLVGAKTAPIEGQKPTVVASPIVQTVTGLETIPSGIKTFCVVHSANLAAKLRLQNVKVVVMKEWDATYGFWPQFKSAREVWLIRAGEEWDEADKRLRDSFDIDMRWHGRHFCTAIQTAPACVYGRYEKSTTAPEWNFPVGTYLVPVPQESQESPLSWKQLPVVDDMEGFTIEARAIAADKNDQHKR